MGITLEEVPQLIFSLLCKYQKRHTYLTALENDYNSGNYGTITSEAYLLIEDLAKREIALLNHTINSPFSTLHFPKLLLVRREGFHYLS